MKIDVEGFEAEVLKGLSQPIKALSLEFLPAAIDVAIEAVDLLERSAAIDTMFHSAKAWRST